MGFYEDAIREAEKLAEYERLRPQREAEYAAIMRKKQVDRIIAIIQAWCKKIGMPTPTDISCDDIGSFQWDFDGYVATTLTAMVTWVSGGYNYSAKIEGADDWKYPFMNEKIVVQIEVGGSWYPVSNKADIGKTLLERKK